MHYEINVTLNGVHLFATAPRSLLTEEKAGYVFDILQGNFPESDGYRVTCSKIETVGTDMRWSR